MEHLILPLLVFLVAMLYSSVGHGGASGYLAVLAIMSISVALLRPSALLLNLFVSGIAFARFAASGHFRWNLFWPFALGSIPLAFIGAGITPDPELFKKLLALCLLFAVGRLFGLFGSRNAEQKILPIAWAILIGAGIGLLSGIIGIGGGIILSPIILLFRWSNAHEAAAVSALFILVNSAAGLWGLQEHTAFLSTEIIGWLTAAITGGLVGSYLGAERATNLRLQQILGCVLLAASAKLFLS